MWHPSPRPTSTSSKGMSGTYSPSLRRRVWSNSLSTSRTTEVCGVAADLVTRRLRLQLIRWLRLSRPIPPRVLDRDEEPRRLPESVSRPALCYLCSPACPDSWLQRLRVYQSRQPPCEEDPRVRDCPGTGRQHRVLHRGQLCVRISSAQLLDPVLTWITL